MSNLAEPFDDDPAVLAAHDSALATFATWCDGVEPDDTVGAAQLGLMRWQRAKFGDQPDERMALGIIEELVETFDAGDHAEDAVDGLGDVCVYASQLATNNRLAIAPIIDLARTFTARRDIIALRASGVLAQVVLKGSQKIRGLDDRTRYRTRLVGAIAMCISKAMEDVEMIHVLDVKVAGVFVTIANEVMKRGDGHPGIPQQVPAAVVTSRVTTAERQQKAMEAMQAATEDETDPDTFDLSDGPTTTGE